MLVSVTGLGGIVGSCDNVSICGNNNISASTINKKEHTAQPRPSILIQTHGIGPVTEINPNHVICGRKGRIWGVFHL